MPIYRRHFLQLAGAAAALPAASGGAMAQAYPIKPVRLIVGFSPGGPNDILGRLIAGWLSQRMGQPFVVENQAGRSGNIATEVAVKAAPDGYTLLLVGPANAISGSLYNNLPFIFCVRISGLQGAALGVFAPAASMPRPRLQ